MNQRIKELAEQAGFINSQFSESGDDCKQELNRFAKLIVRECVNQCHQEWYDLNNVDPKENETPRDIGIRVGQKNGVLKTISRIEQHFGIKDQLVPILSANDRALFTGIGSSQSFTIEGATKHFGVVE